jgi:acyl-CoA thioesterase
MKARGRISPAGGHEAHLSAIAYISDSNFIGTVARTHKLMPHDPQLQRIKNGQDPSKDAGPKPQIGMIVSLDHTIYFHNPRSFRADEWMFREMETPWADDGRGLVFQRMYTKDGTLIATCVQEVRILLSAHIPQC